MLENFERISGKGALEVFIDNAEKMGVYKSVRDSTEFKKHKDKLFSRSIDVGRFSEIRKESKSTIDECYPELPLKYSKLVTFKPVQNNDS